MSSWHSYPKIYNMGHAALADLLKDIVTVEEKIDGSQFSFGRFVDEIKLKSKRCELHMEGNTQNMFDMAIDTVKNLAHRLRDGWTYRTEYLNKPKHNALAYDRIPERTLIIYDINTEEETYLSYRDKKSEAERIGLETVPLLYKGVISDLDTMLDILNRMSILGGQQIEGVVIKNYSRFGRDGKALMGKHVRESFRELNKSNWNKENKGQGAVLEVMKARYRTDARWDKAVQHLEEDGTLTWTPKDIGPLMKEVQTDMLAECEEDIKEQLFKWAKGDISRASSRGLAEWYKQKLLERQFV